MNYTARKKENNQLRGHQLMTADLKKRLPPLYSAEHQGDSAIILVKYYMICVNWYWYGIEFDGEDTFFGIVFGYEVEKGYFPLSELEILRDQLGQPVQRDLDFEPTTLAQVVQEHRAREEKLGRTYHI